MRLRYRQLLLKCRFAPLGKSLWHLKSLSSRVFFEQWDITAFSEKSYHKKAPHRPTKNDNQTKAFAFKNLYVYKALSWRVFQTARVQRSSRWNIAESITLRGAILLCAHSPIRGVRRTNFKARQKSTGNFYTCTLALYHINSVLSIKYKHLFAIFCLLSYNTFNLLK